MKGERPSQRILISPLFLHRDTMGSCECLVIFVHQELEPGLDKLSILSLKFNLKILTLCRWINLNRQQPTREESVIPNEISSHVDNYNPIGKDARETIIVLCIFQFIYCQLKDINIHLETCKWLQHLFFNIKCVFLLKYVSQRNPRILDVFCILNSYPSRILVQYL